MIIYRDNLDTDIYGANIYNQILSNINNKSKEEKKKSDRLPNLRPMELNKDRYIVKEKSDLYQSPDRSTTHFEFFVNDSSFKSEATKINSILVKTGVFQGDEKTIESQKDDLIYTHKDMLIDKSLRKPDFLVKDVHEAVKLIYERENFI